MVSVQWNIFRHKNEGLTSVTTWMNLENIMLSHKRPHFYKIFGIGESVEKDRRLPGQEGNGEDPLDGFGQRRWTWAGGCLGGTARTLNATELDTLKGFILCYKNFSPTKKHIQQCLTS